MQIEKLKYLEKIYYKLIVDLLLTLNKYNFTSSNINIKILDYTNNILTDLKFSDFISIQTFYIQNSELNKTGSICGTGTKIYLNTLQTKNSLLNGEVLYYITDVSKNYQIQKKYNETKSIIDINLSNSQYNKLESLIKQYVKISAYIENTKNLIIAQSYSPCYVNRGWSQDGASKQNFDVFTKYNLFDINLNSIKIQSDLNTIKRIIS